MRRLSLLLFAAFFGAGLPACAHRAAPTLVDVEIVDRNSGERLPIYWHQGERWVAGVPGHRYGVRIANRTGGRLLAVVSVDGVNAISGETAAWHQSGYVFMPWQNYEITGWRKSETRVAAFEFTALANAYAARTGRPDQVGAIGVAVFREMAPPAPAAVGRSDSRSGSEAASARDGSPPAAEATAKMRSESDLAAMQRQESRLGTGHGRSETSVVTHTLFERAAPHPDQVMVIRYDSRERLIARGVIAQPVTASAPNPFPGSTGFVPDPPR